MKIINEQNWTYTHYKATDFKAFVSIGGAPELADDDFIYMATIIDTNENEILQKDFKSIDAACDFLNSKYSDLWDFVDARVAKKEGGCDSCAAH